MRQAWRWLGLSCWEHSVWLTWATSVWKFLIHSGEGDPEASYCQESEDALCEPEKEQSKAKN